MVAHGKEGEVEKKINLSEELRVGDQQTLTGNKEQQSPSYSSYRTSSSSPLSLPSFSLRKRQSVSANAKFSQYQDSYNKSFLLLLLLVASGK